MLRQNLSFTLRCVLVVVILINDSKETVVDFLTKMLPHVRFKILALPLDLYKRAQCKG